MKSLTTKQLLETNGGGVYYCWFHPDTAGWSVKAIGRTSYVVYPRNKRRGCVITLDALPVSFEERYPIEEGVEVDGHGHIFFFEKYADIEAFIAHKKGEHARCLEAVTRASENLLGSSFQV